MLTGGVSQIRAEFDHGQGYTGVRLRRPGRWKRVLMLLPAIAIWVFGGGFALIMLAATSNEPAFFYIWLTAWGLGGFAFIATLAARAFTTETLVIRSDGVTLVRRFLLLAFPTHLPAAQIADLRFVPDDLTRTYTVNGRRIPQTSFEIVGNPRNLRFAHGISQAEAQAVITAVKQRLAVSWKRPR